MPNWRPETWALLRRTLGRGPTNQAAKPIPNAMDWPTTLATWRAYSNPDARFAFAALYCSGQRLNEFTPTRRADIRQEWVEGRPYLMVQSKTEKKKTGVRFRQISIPFNRRDNELVNYLWTRAQAITNPDTRLWNLTPRTIQNYLAKVTVTVQAANVATESFQTLKLPIHPHYLRHCRATHLAMDYGYGFKALMTYFGWTDPAMADWYVNPDSQATAREFNKTSFDYQPEAKA